MRQVQCISCQRLGDLRKDPKHASVGFGRCPDDPSGAFVSLTFVRDCCKFEKVTAPRSDREEALKWWQQNKNNVVA